MKSNDVPNRANAWIRLAALGVAGGSALAAGMLLTRPSTGETEAEVVASSARVPRSTVSVSNSTLGDGARSPESASALAPLTGDRLTEHVTYNPFAALNLSAASSPAPAASAGRVTAKVKREPELAPAPTPRPTAPPLPFIAVGSIAGPQVTGGQPFAFVKVQDQLLVIRSGDAIGATYRVEAITPQRIEFMYLPLMQRQTLALAP